MDELFCLGDASFLRRISGRISAMDWESTAQYLAVQDRVREIAGHLEAMQMKAEIQVWVPEERFEITGRGTVFTGRFPLHTRGSECIGRRLRINGEDWIIRGYEKMAHAVPLGWGQPCGLLVKKVKDDD